MPEVPTQPSAEPQRWSAANAKDRIAIVTTDFLLDARIRAAFQGENYEFVTVPDFELYQNELTDTTLGIIDARSRESWNISFYVKRSEFWSYYPLFGIVEVEPDDSSGGLIFGYVPWDMELRYDFNPEELVDYSKRIIEVTREYEDEPYRI